MKSSSQKNIRVTFLTVGEYPTKNGLHASQVLPFAEYLVKKGVTCKWIAFYPIETWIKDIITKQFKLSKMIEFASKKGVILKAKSFPITFGRLHSYLFRDFLIKSAGKKLSAILISSKKEELHIVHCRSYFAAAVALAARNLNKNISVSFDMRSLLPPEVPLLLPQIGRAFYGGLKIWESHLLEKCDYSFLPVKEGIALLEKEGHKRLPTFMPIIGFDSTKEELSRVQPSMKPSFAYVGGFGPWHSSVILNKIFDTLSNCLHESQFRVLSSDQVTFSMPVQINAVSNLDVKSSIQDLWAIVVPGPEKVEGYFESIQLHVNLFSTKAAEALSLGVPLIVNQVITELANYVREHGCGIIFSVERGKIQFHGIEPSELCNPKMWLSLRKAAILCAPTFNRSRIFENYLKVWLESNDYL
jgi:hypothetical protein